MGFWIVLQYHLEIKNYFRVILLFQNLISHPMNLRQCVACCICFLIWGTVKVTICFPVRIRGTRIIHTIWCIFIAILLLSDYAPSDLDKTTFFRFCQFDCCQFCPWPSTQASLLALALLFLVVLLHTNFSVCNSAIPILLFLLPLSTVGEIMKIKKMKLSFTSQI